VSVHSFVIRTSCKRRSIYIQTVDLLPLDNKLHDRESSLFQYCRLSRLLYYDRPCLDARGKELADIASAVHDILKQMEKRWW